MCCITCWAVCRAMLFATAQAQRDSRSSGAGCWADRCRVGDGRGADPAPAANHRAATARPPHGAQWDRMGDTPGCILACTAPSLREVGHRETAFKRYQLWCAEGRWERIAEALGIEEHEVAL